MENAARNLDAALNLVAAGLFVFPAGVSQHTGAEKWVKSPLIVGWQSKATTDPAQVRKWWQIYPKAVPGIELDKSGLVVLDGDRHGGPDGVTALNDILGADTPRHPISLTAGGGEHHFFRQPPEGEPLGNSTGSLPKAIDVRGKGGYIIAPGSVRPDGKVWQPDPQAPALPDAFSSGTIPVIPDHVVNLIRPAPSLVTKAEPQTISQRAVAQIDLADRRGQSYGAALLNGVCQEVSAAQDGTRNETLNAAAYRAGRAVASGLVDRGEAEQKLYGAATACGLVADGANAVLATMRSGLNAGVQKPLAPLADRALSNVIQFPEAKPSVLRWHDNDNALAMPKWLVKKLLLETGAALISGQWSSGKTFVALHLAECVATGKPFAGRKVKRQGGTLFMAAEAAGDIPIRLRGITAAPLSGRQDRLPFTWVEEVPSISKPMALERMIEIAREAALGMEEKFGLPLALIIIDTMAAAAGFDDENDAAQAQVVMNVLHGLARETGALVVAVDHFGKKDDNGTRGSSAKEASADAVLSLITSQTKEGVVEGRTLAIRKLRGGSTGDQIGFSLVPISFGVDEDGDEITTCIVEFSSEPVAARAALNSWDKLRDLKQALDIALAEDGRDVRPYGAEGPEVWATPLKAVRAEFYKAYHAEDSDTCRQALNRQIKKASLVGLVCTREVNGEKFVWIAAQPIVTPADLSAPEAIAAHG